MKRSVYFTLSIVVINAVLFVLGVFDIFDSWPLYQIPLFQIGWLYTLGEKFGLDVIGKSNEFASSPNSFGWVLVILGTLITFYLYYLLYKAIFKR